MYKRLVLILLFVNLSLLSFSSDLIYPLGDKDEVKFSGHTDYTRFSLGLGESKNESISPNYFHTFSVILDLINSEREYSKGVLFRGIRLTPTVLTPSVPVPNAIIIPIPTLQNFKVRNENTIGFRFYIPKIPRPDNLDFSIGPYGKFDWMVSYYPAISNVGAPTFFTINLGTSLNLNYQVDTHFNIGMTLSSFIIGIDLGRSTYNKQLNTDINLTHYGNYQDLDLSLYYALDLSRSESLKVEYNHSLQSIHGIDNPIIAGENRLSITYCRRLFR